MSVAFVPAPHRPTPSPLFSSNLRPTLSSLTGPNGAANFSQMSGSVSMAYGQPPPQPHSQLHQQPMSFPFTHQLHSSQSLNPPPSLPFNHSNQMMNAFPNSNAFPSLNPASTGGSYPPTNPSTNPYSFVNPNLPYSHAYSNAHSNSTPSSFYRKPSINSFAPNFGTSMNDGSHFHAPR